MKRRLLAVSDIHGHYQLLEKLMQLVDYRPHYDDLIVCGDLIDRGPDAFKVIDWFLPGHPGQEAIVLKGNHEAGLEKLLKGEIPLMNYCNDFMGGSKTLQSYLNASDLDIMKHLDFIGRLKLYHVQDGYIFVHAGVSCHQHISYQSEADLTLDQAKYYLKEGHLRHREIVVFGHTPTNIIRQQRHEPIPARSYVWYDSIYRNKIGIDCGNKEQKRLCCLDLTNGLEYYVGFYPRDTEIRHATLT